MFSLFSRCDIPYIRYPVSVDTSWWNSGIYIKWNDTQLMNQYTTVKNELRDDLPAIQGAKFAMYWGRHETDANTRDFSQIGTILDDFAAMTPQRRLIIGLVQREFKSSNGVTLLLPADMRTAEATYTWNYTDNLGVAKSTVVNQYKYAWPYIQANNSGSYGYNLKMWNSTDGGTLLARFRLFFDALVAYLDAHPNGHLVEHIGETESVIGNPVVPSVYTTTSGEGSTARGTQTFTNKSVFAQYCNTSMRNSGRYFMQGLNFTNDYMEAQAAQLVSRKMGLSTPDHHAGSNLNIVMRYFQNGIYSLAGQVPLAAECQADSFEGTYGLMAAKDYPSPLALYNRAVYLGNTHFVIQRITSGEDYDYWNTGAPGKGGMKLFLQTHPAIINDPLRAGGLASAIPSCLIDT